MLLSGGAVLLLWILALLSLDQMLARHDGCARALTVGFLLGFLLGVFLGAQLLSGFLLACGYLPDPAFAFDSVQALVRTLPGMWLLVHQQATQIAGFVFCFGPHGTHWCGERSCRCK